MDGGFVERFDDLYAVGYRAGFAVLGRRADAEDCAQEALARALVRWSKVARVRPRRGWRAWRPTWPSTAPRRLARHLPDRTPDGAPTIPSPCAATTS